MKLQPWLTAHENCDWLTGTATSPPKRPLPPLLPLLAGPSLPLPLPLLGGEPLPLPLLGGEPLPLPLEGSLPPLLLPPPPQGPVLAMQSDGPEHMFETTDRHCPAQPALPSRRISVALALLREPHGSSIVHMQLESPGHRPE